MENEALANLSKICRKVIETAMHSISKANLGYLEVRRVEGFLYQAFDQALARRHKELMELSQLNPSLLQLEQTLKERRRTFRMGLAKELKASRKRLIALQDEIEALQVSVNHLRSLQVTTDLRFPEIPTRPLVEVNAEGIGLPSSPGIYFVWSGGAVVYVGKSVCLSQRVRVPGGHHALFSGDWVSFLPYEAKDLSFAESYYIGITRAMRNFGGARRLQPDPPTLQARG